MRTRKQLAVVEAENVLKATVKYLAAKPTRRLAPFDLNWLTKLHSEMFGDVWEWAGKWREFDLNIGVVWYQVEAIFRTWSTNWSTGRRIGPTSLNRRPICTIAPCIFIPSQMETAAGRELLANIWLRLHDHDVTIGQRRPSAR